jgi:hypothetical protein
LGVFKLVKLGKVDLDVKMMAKYRDELSYKLIIIHQEIKEKQETLDFTNNFLETCIVPFPNLDKDKK